MPKQRLPSNVKVRTIIVTDLAQQLKKRRDFLKWMARKYLEENAEQAAAFTTGADQLDEIRTELLDGLFDLDPKEELTKRPGSRPPGSSSCQEDPPGSLTSGEWNTIVNGKGHHSSD